MKNYIVVTGASRGLGKELSKQLAKLGYYIVLTARNEKTGKKVMQEILEYSPKSTLLFQNKCFNSFGIVLKTPCALQCAMIGTQHTMYFFINSFIIFGHQISIRFWL